MKQESNIINNLADQIKFKRDYELIKNILKTSNKKEFEKEWKIFNILYKLCNSNFMQALEIYLNKKEK